MAGFTTLALVETADGDNPDVHDLRLTNGHLTFISGLDAIKQKLRIRLNFFRGEWYQDQRLGVPYWTHVFVKNPDLAVLERLFRKVIMSTPGVSLIESFSLSFDSSTRSLSMDFAARTEENDEVVMTDFIIAVPTRVMP